MDLEEIRACIKQAIARVSKIDPDTIDDRALFRDDLGLDSLSVLEALVDVQCRYQIADLPEADYSRLSNVDEAARLVQRFLPTALV